MTSTLTSPHRLYSPTITSLENGLTIVAEQMPIEAVSLNIWLKVGSATESDSINGMAHFLEHMIFKGTDRLASGEFERLIEAKGAITNAATSQEYTQYYINTAPRDFSELAPLQLEVVFNALIPEAEFERERLVVLEEIRRSEDNPQRRTFSQAMETCFNQLPYRRPVLGPAEVISQLTPQQMRDFHDYWYQPESMTVAVVGNLPVTELTEIVTTAVSDTHRRPKPSVKPASIPNWSVEPPFTEIVRQESFDSSLQQARLIMMWRVPGMEQLSDTYPLDVLAAILGQGKLARLFRDLREERGLVSQISAGNLTQNIQGAFYISAKLPADNLAVVEAAIIEHLQRLHTEPVTSAEVNRIRTQVANKFIFSNEKPSDRALLYGYYQSLLGSVAPALNYPQAIEKITPADLQAAAKHYLTTDAYGIVTITPN